MEVAGLPPGKFQSQLVVLAEAVLANFTSSGPQPVVGVAVKLAVGWVTMVTVWVAVAVPQELVAVSVTV